MSKAEQAAENFTGQSGSIKAVEKCGRGIINDTYLVELSGQADSFILQRINTHVFKRPELIMHNLRLVCEYIHTVKKITRSRSDSDWKMLRIIPTRDNRDFFIDPEGGFWRALSFIHGSHSLENISNLDNAREAGRALGMFHHLTDNLDPALLHDTLPGFHNIEHYLSHYDQVLSSRINREFTESEKLCGQFVEERRSWAPVLENARKHDKLQVRIIHGDLKINNVMLDNQTGEAVSIIDLDTVKPGLLLYDIGDCLRSCCNISEEESDDFDAVRFDPKRCEAALSGYMGVAHACLTPQDFNFLFDAIRLIPFELGLRFYTDYLEGNPYFKVSHPKQNLELAMVQFRLVESVEQQEVGIRAIIEESRSALSDKNT
jgi:Ser/Thr protein kinase RdoA (MazF antagonist)